MNHRLLFFFAPLLAAAAPPPPPARVQSVAEAIDQDAAQYAAHYALSLEEAMRRLRALDSSLAATNRIRAQYRGRLAGIAVEHAPELRIVVLLTGEAPVAEQRAGSVPIVFRTGARASREAMILALRQHQTQLRALYPSARGMGLDQRRGALVLLASRTMAEREPIAAIAARTESILGVPVRVTLADQVMTDFALAGGARVIGADPVSGVRYACTTGFLVTDGARHGIATAAHCPDQLTYFDPEGGEAALPFIGQWGSRVYDVQINAVPDGLAAPKPLFYANRKSGALRRLTSWRNRESSRAGDIVCHYGESSGYSCSEVELTDYAPPGELCAGACEPAWTTVRGPQCRAGDSGGPVFVGTVAIGISKGGSAGPGGTCNFYYFMSVDYLPPGWRLLR